MATLNCKRLRSTVSVLVSMCPAMSGGSNTKGKGDTGHGHHQQCRHTCNLAARASVLKFRLDHFTSLLKTVL